MTLTVYDSLLDQRVDYIDATTKKTIVNQICLRVVKNKLNQQKSIYCNQQVK